jgi:poly(A)-specific ribonuclease
MSSYNGFIMAKRKDFSVELKRLTVEERDAIAKEAGQALLIGVENLSQVVRTMVEAKKPLVGHNCLLDICHIIQHFWDDLPESVEGWRKMMLQLWDRVIDTKQLAHHHADILAFNNTTLANIMSIVNDVPFTENCAEIGRFTKH